MANIRKNGEIRVPEVRVLDYPQKGNSTVMSTSEALRLAASNELDLIEITPNAKPPVCQLDYYGKYCYEKKRKAKEAQKNQQKTEEKEIRLRPSIAENDYGVKLKNAQKFISDGNRVRVMLSFRGREMMHSAASMVLMKNFRDALVEMGARVESEPKLEGRSIIMVLIGSTAK